jgi:hypothetical protein
MNYVYQCFEICYPASGCSVAFAQQHATASSSLEGRQYLEPDNLEVPHAGTAAVHNSLATDKQQNHNNKAASG